MVPLHPCRDLCIGHAQVHSPGFAKRLKHGAQRCLRRMARIAGELILRRLFPRVFRVRVGVRPGHVPGGAFGGGVDVDLGGVIICPECQPPHNGVRFRGPVSLGKLQTCLRRAARGGQEPAVSQLIEPANRHGKSSLQIVLIGRHQGSRHDSASQRHGRLRVATEVESLHRHSASTGKDGPGIRDRKLNADFLTVGQHHRGRFIQVHIHPRHLLPVRQISFVRVQGGGHLCGGQAARGGGHAILHHHHAVVAVQFVHGHHFGAGIARRGILLRAVHTDHTRLRGPGLRHPVLLSSPSDLRNGEIQGISERFRASAVSEKAAAARCSVRAKVRKATTSMETRATDPKTKTSAMPDRRPQNAKACLNFIAEY